MFKKIGTVIAKVLVCVVLLLGLAIAVTSVSPIYDFAPQSRFEGPDIFNPYRAYVDSLGWKRANFHTHTRVEGPLNECEFWPEDVLRALEKFGYEIVTLSNHNEITEHPRGGEWQVNVYEHGYSFFKYHKLVFGSASVNHFDHLLPILTSQRQWQLDYLGKNADFIQLNHPFRTNLTTEEGMKKLTGYRIMELDSGVTTEQEYWDWALSAGHYSFGLANDDLHYPDRSDRIAVRCNWLNCPSAHYDDLKACLLGGCYYSMRVPDFGDGDWDVKYECNRHLPGVEEIGLADGDSIYIKVSDTASRIVAVGQDHCVLKEVRDTVSMGYRIGERDSYARLTVYFDNGVVIYSNPFARYDSSVSDSPYCVAEHSVNWPLTILFNLLIVVVVAGIVLIIILLVRKKK